MRDPYFRRGGDDEAPRFRSKVQAYGHFVWATKGRQPNLDSAIERNIYRVIIHEAEQLKCIVLALGGMPDHVHLVLRIPGRYSPADVMKQIKGASSTAFNELRPEYKADGGAFYWQPGYGFFSLGQSEAERERVTAYVRNQKECHANNDLWLEWEETDENV